MMDKPTKPLPTPSLFASRRAASSRRKQKQSALSFSRRGRRLAVGMEQLESRNLMAVLPFGAMPDDTGEYMLGNVVVNVVLMESDSSMAPYDDFSSTGDEENWTAEQISAVKDKVVTGVNWWKDTLHNEFPNAPADILNFQFDFTYADSPVHTGYEPIANWSGQFGSWVYDFLSTAGFVNSSSGQSQSGFIGDLKAFNNAKRLEYEADWSFTIFVVNDANDDDGMFAAPPANAAGFRLSFAYAGGVAIVMPASRPASTVAHETGHQFWALDEYDRSSSWYNRHRGYYDTQNTNANPSPGFTPETSIMSGGQSVLDAYAQNTSSTPSMAMIGWRDSDGDGIFDVLDVPFALSGYGSFDAGSRSYTFHGASQVRTLKNLNPESLQNDITINKIRVAEYSENNGPWTPIATYNDYTVGLDLDIPISIGTTSLRIRTFDTRTGVASDIFTDNFTQPVYPSSEHGISGYVFNDIDGAGYWNGAEKGLAGWQVSLVDQFGGELVLRHTVDPDNSTSGQAIDTAGLNLTLTAYGSDVANSVVYSKVSFSATAAGRAFGVGSASEARTVDTWNQTRRMRAGFLYATSTVSIDAYGTGEGSYARLEAYDSLNRLLDRVTTGVIGAGEKQTLTISRAQGDIAYIVAFGHAGTSIVLDNLSWGSETTTTTDSEGRYSFSDLGPGTFVVHVTPQNYYRQTFPQSIDHLVQLTTFAPVNNLNFGFQVLPNVWRNPSNPLDVNRDGFVSPSDALAVINWLNANLGVSEALGGVPGTNDALLDVSGDSYCSPADVLMVINYLNRPTTTTLGNFSVPLTAGGSGSGGTSTAAGESDSSASDLSSSNSSVAVADGESGSSALFSSSLALLSSAGDPQALGKAYRSAGFFNAPQDYSLLDPHRGGCTCGSCLEAPLAAYLAASDVTAPVGSDLGDWAASTLAEDSAAEEGDADQLLGTLALALLDVKQKLVTS